MFPNSLCMVNNTLISIPDKDTTHTKKLQVNISDEHRCRYLHIILANQIQYIIGSYTMIKRDLFQGCRMVQICKLINMTHHINKMKYKNQMIISVDAEKAFDEIQYPFMVKTLNKVSI